MSFRNPFKFSRKGSKDDRESSDNPDSVLSVETSTASSRQSSFLRSFSPTSPLQSHPASTSQASNALSATTSNSTQASEAGSLGLTVVYSPDHGHKADIVFVHGLGGTSRHTWSKYKSPELFWPLTFLPLEPDICLTRILTFGYNANFRQGGNISSSILDFAKELLFDLKFGKDGQKNELNMGNVPLIFVVHSMGGLIVKEAYIQGQIDPEYQAIIKQISAITFLATPHRGTNLADVLDRILQSTFVTSSKKYIKELSKNSFTLQKLNEQFRHIAPNLEIVSFYETQKTQIGTKAVRIMVLEKDSSILGYPGETSKSLNADHHGICKYESPKDPNYITVRNVLKSLVSKIIAASRPKENSASSRRESLDVKSYLAVMELPDIDLIFFRDQWTEGTNGWILHEEPFKEWLHSAALGPRFLWLHGGAGTGKSVLSSFIISRLAEQGHCCQYFFIRSGDKKKRTLSLLLRTIAYQIAQQFPEFCTKVLELAEQAIDFNTADPNTIWDRLFKSLLFQMENTPVLYWIIDGLDEADSARSIVRQLASIPSLSVSIRIMLVSRNTSEIAAAIQKIPASHQIGSIGIEGHLDDMRCYIGHELSMSGTEEYKKSIARRIVEGSQNIFLWVRFVIEKLNSCDTNEDVELVLRELPVGMEELYDRMASKVIENPSPRKQTLALAILRCTTCSLRVLTVIELSQALSEDTSQLLDLQRSILDLCGGFVVIDNVGNVAMIHETAREYLLGDTLGPLSVDRSEGHEQMFLSCMRSLMAVGVRGKIGRNQKIVFLDYAASWWSFHLTSVPFENKVVSETLIKFLTGPSVLVWIEILTMSKQLRLLVQASRNLLKYCAQQPRHSELDEDELDQKPMPRSLFKSWAMDFVNIVGRFGTLLQRDSSSIYKLIPPFCPQSSSVYQQFGRSESKTISISGLSQTDWDDSLARLSTGLGTYTASVMAAGAQIAILTSPGNVFTYDSSTFEEGSASPIRHNELVYRIALNNTGTLLVSYGYRTTKVWQVSTGKCQLVIRNDESRSRPLALMFVNNDSNIILGTDDRRIQSINLKLHETDWKLVAELDEPQLEGHLINSASNIDISPDGNLVGVGYRGHPASAWELDGKFHIGHCWLQGRERQAHGEVNQLRWHPHEPELFGLYREGTLFKWRPYEEACDEISGVGISLLELSKDGNLFATGDVHGTVKVYTTAHFKLIYQLGSQDPVLDLAFSPDLRRLYDIRGYYGNAWEPNALARFAEQTDKGVDGESETDSLTQSSTTSAKHTPWVDSVTVLSSSPSGMLYCYGTEKGMVELRDVQGLKLDSFQTSKSHLSIEAMCWSICGKYISFSDSSKTIFVLSVYGTSSNMDPHFVKVFQMPMRSLATGHISQLLFTPDSGSLLVYTVSMMSNISLSSATVTHATPLDKVECKWILHPQDPDLLIGFGTDTIQLLDLSFKRRRSWVFDLEVSRVLPPEILGHLDPGQYTVDRLLVDRSKRHILMQVSAFGHSSRHKTFVVFNVSSFHTMASLSPGFIDLGQITPIALPIEITSQAMLALAFLSDNRLVLLTRNFSISSWQVSFSTNGDVDIAAKTGTELFSLPGDWVSRECLSLSYVWTAERSLLCPKNGEVAVVRCNTLV